MCQSHWGPTIFFFPFFKPPSASKECWFIKMWQYLKNCLCFGWRKWGVLELLGNIWNEVSFFCLLWGMNGGTKILTTYKGGVLKAPGLLILFWEDGDVICCHQWWEPPCLQGPKCFYILFGRGWRYKFLPPMRWINMPSMGLLFFFKFGNRG